MNDTYFLKAVAVATAAALTVPLLSQAEIEKKPTVERASIKKAAVAEDPDAVTFKIADGGQVREFELATDELHGYRLDQTQLKAAGLESKKGLEDAVKHAKDLSKVVGVDLYPILYIKGLPRDESTRRILTPRVTVKLEEGADAAAIATAAGGLKFDTPDYADGYIILHLENPTDGLTRIDAIRSIDGVESADPVLRSQKSKKFVPNDPLYPQQLHLNDPIRDILPPEIADIVAADINAEAAWDLVQTRGFSSEILIVDDGLDFGHADLAAHVEFEAGINYNDLPLGADPPFTDGIDQGVDPFGLGKEDFHGTAVAGLAGAIINNGVGVAGASDARLVSVRLVSEPSDDVQEGMAFSHRLDFATISNNGWGPPDDGTVLSGPGPLGDAALSNGVRTGRFNRGIIYTWNAGNGAQLPFEVDHSNFDGYANSIYTIAVGAINAGLVREAYSESGANLTCVAFGDAPGTTDVTGADGYVPTSYVFFGADIVDGGTSAAQAQVSGVIALMVEARPALKWRDVQEILIASSRDFDGGLDPLSPGWFTNAEGYTFHLAYGSGLVDAAAAVATAAGWERLDPWSSPLSKQSVSNAINIPDGGGPVFKDVFFVTEDNMRVEQVEVQVDIDHERRRDLLITLITPEFTQSILSIPSVVDAAPQPLADFPDWTFTSAQLWGECSIGAWTVRVQDLIANGLVGTFRDAVITFHGVEMAPPPIPSEITDPTPQFGQVDVPFRHLIRASKGAFVYKASNLPPGLAVDTRNGLVTGVPLDHGTFLVDVEATNDYGTGRLTIPYTIAPPTEPTLEVLLNIIDPIACAPVFAPLPLGGLRGVPFGWRADFWDSTFNPNDPTDCALPFTDDVWIPPGQGNDLTFTMTNVPPGLIFNNQLATLTGIPLSSGTYEMVFTVTHDTRGTDIYPILLTIGNTFPFGAPPEITGVTFPVGPLDTGEFFRFFVITTGGTPYHYSATNLPPGFSIDSQSGIIYGTTLVDGTYNVGLSATNDWGTDFFMATVVIGDPTIVVPGVPAIAGLTYDMWKEAIFTPAELADSSISGPDGDSDDDGNTNFTEYALNLNAREFDNQGLPEFSIDDRGMNFSYYKDPLRSDVEYTAEVSRDLVTWTDAATEITTTNAIVEGHETSIMIDGEPNYVRLSLKQVAPGSQ